MHESGGWGIVVRRCVLCASAIAIMALGVRPAWALTPAGDCNDDGAVIVNEIVVAVTIALGTRPLADCVAADTNADDIVDVADLIRAVNEALQGGPDAAFRFSR